MVCVSHDKHSPPSTHSYWMEKMRNLERLREHKSSEYTHSTPRMIAMLVESSNHLFYNPRLWHLFPFHALVWYCSQIGNLIGCRIAGCSAAKSRSD